MNAYSLIRKYFPPDSEAFHPYLTHVTLVTSKALKKARELNLSDEDQLFIEEAGLLHDIGISQVDFPEIGLYSGLPYILHTVEGGKILRAEGLPKHARVAENHIGVGIRSEDVRREHLPLPEQDLIPETLPEEIISWADLFYSKNPGKLWQEHTWPEIEDSVRKFGQWQIERLQYYHEKFGE